VNHEKPVHFEEKAPDKLKEMLGHKPEEVLGGAILGVITGTLGYLMDRKR
jgi:hypothetical protein